ncbi:hypothetical protein Pmani_003994 [Petrolisthes manimaculis]|uniref:Uncharacterized protein n=1 Tax=Petrolisthes manimaculis TaxID=1843537 RepID=A0AAE1UPE9_9EUCA|nr:hypothetical protein Pmani_003994 [Petrolisthes manimaculis]
MQRSLLKNQKSGQPEVTGSGFTPRSLLSSLQWHTDKETDDGPATSEGPSLRLSPDPDTTIHTTRQPPAIVQVQTSPKNLTGEEICLHLCPLLKCSKLQCDVQED